MSSPTAPSADASSFASTELVNSLSEIQQWSGIESFRLLSVPSTKKEDQENIAEIMLLEQGDKALISVDQSGWKIKLRSVADYDRLPADSAASDSKTFETLEHLLAYLSPEFEKKRMQVLSDRLEGISVERGSPEKDQKQD